MEVEIFLQRAPSQPLRRATSSANARGRPLPPEEELEMLGFVEVILLLLGLSNFGLQANPNPPTADASLQYAMADADIVVHVDAATFVPNNYKALMQLANQPQIKSSPDLLKMVRKMVAEVDGVRGMAKSMVGIDPTT